MRIGLIARADSSGLGNLSWELANHLNPTRVLIVQNGVFQIFPKRYEPAEYLIVPPTETINIDRREWLFEKSDVIVAAETFYNWGIVEAARKKKKRTALITMFEMTAKWLEIKPDLFICPSRLDFAVMPSPKVYLPFPVNTKRLEWRERKKAKIFIHPASHGGMNFRKGTPLLIEAMKYVKARDIKVIIYTWVDFKCDDPRVEIKKVNFENYWQLWEEGDVLIYPQDYNGISLPIQEALASGLAIISTDIYPFNEYLSKELLFKPDGFYKTSAADGLIEVQAAKIDPRKIAEKIDQIANKDISTYSQYGKIWAENNSWDKWKPKYMETLKNLIKQDI